MTGGFGAVAATTAKEAAVARSPKVMGEATMMSKMRVWGRKDSRGWMGLDDGLLITYVPRGVVGRLQSETGPPGALLT
jgi:hypothetical protein